MVMYILDYLDSGKVHCLQELTKLQYNTQVVKEAQITFPWCRGQDAYFDVRVFYPNASSYRSLSLASADKRHEDAKKCEYGQHVREVEYGVFTPLVCTSTGGVGREATVFYKRLADLLATHWGQPYSSTIHWLRCRLSFALLRSAILCIRGSRSSVHRPVKGPLDLSVVLVESWLTD